MARKHALLAALAVATILAHGCATNKALVDRNALAVSELKVDFYRTPEIMVRSFFKETAAGVLGALIFGGIGAGNLTASVIHQPKTNERLPDIGKLIAQKFIERMSKDRTDWPKMKLKEYPIIEEYKEEGMYIGIKVTILELEDRLSSTTVGVLRDSSGAILWRKSYSYRSNDHKRAHSTKDFLADDARLLREELDFAAERTAEDFVSDLLKTK